MSEFLVTEEVDARDDLVRPSLSLLMAAAGTVLVSAALIPAADLLLSPVPLHATGWLLASVLPFAFVAAQRQAIDRTRASRDVIITVPGWLSPTTLATLLAGMFVAGLHSWLLATELAS